MKSRSKIWLILGLLIVGIMVAGWLKIRPKVLLEVHSPHQRGGYVRIVETPTSWAYGLLSYNPYYRFEYHWDNGYLWAAATYFGDSYNAQKVDIKWTSDSEAIVYLDGTAYYKFDGRDRIWVKASNWQ